MPESLHLLAVPVDASRSSEAQTASTCRMLTIETEDLLVLQVVIVELRSGHIPHRADVVSSPGRSSLDDAQVPSLSWSRMYLQRTIGWNITEISTAAAVISRRLGASTSPLQNDEHWLPTAMPREIPLG